MSRGTDEIIEKLDAIQSTLNEHGARLDTLETFASKGVGGATTTENLREPQEPAPVERTIHCIGVRQKKEIGRALHRNSFVDSNGELHIVTESMTHQQLYRPGNTVILGGYETNVTHLGPDTLRMLLERRATLELHERHETGVNKTAITNPEQLEQALSKLNESVPA